MMTYLILENTFKMFETVLNWEDTNTICKILPATFYRSARAWYYSLEPSFIPSFANLCHKLIARFSTNIHIKRSSMIYFPSPS